MNIEEIAGLEDEKIVLNPIYQFQEEGEEDGRVKGKFVCCSRKLLHKEKLLAAGLPRRGFISLKCSGYGF